MRFFPAQGGKRRRLPALLLALLAVSMTFNMGCSANDFVTASSTPITTTGTPLGTTLLNISTIGTNATNTVRHNYVYQVTVQ